MATLDKGDLMKRHGFLWLGAVLFTVLAVAVAYSILKPQYRRLEQAAFTNTLSQAENLLQKDLLALETTVLDYAWWDESYALFDELDPDFVDAEFSTESFGNLGVQILTYITLEGETAIGHYLAPEAASLQNIPPALEQALNTLVLENLEGRTGFLETENDVYLVAYQPVLTTEGEGPSAGYLLMASLLDQAMIDVLSENLGSPVRFEAAPPTVPENWMKILGADRVFGQVPVRDLRDKPVATLSLELPRPLHQQFQQVLGLFVVSLSVLASMATLLVGRGLRRLETTQRQQLENEKKHRQEIEQHAFYDSLTGLPNRRLLQEQAKKIFALADRKNWSLSFLFLDLDRFKTINDSLGHEAGDKLLLEVARRLKACLRESDILARFGGDEFAVVLTDTNQYKTLQIVKRILAAFEAPFALEDFKLNLGVSIGVASYPEHGSDFNELLKATDSAMYKAKAKGGGYQVYNQAERTYSPERLELETRLHEAIQNEAFILHYQPIHDLRSNTISEYEALVRWQGQALSPGVFVPLAEEARMVHRLDALVMSMGVRQLATMHARLSLNLSAQSLRQADLVETVQHLLTLYKVQASQLSIEITETALMADPEVSLEALHQLHALGVKLAIDDFGAGFASLGYLRRLPLYRLKVDRSFVAQIGNKQDERLLLAILELGHSLGLEVLAEGVETKAQLEWLQQHDFDFAQGYFLGKPAPTLVVPEQPPKYPEPAVVS